MVPPLMDRGGVARDVVKYPAMNRITLQQIIQPLKKSRAMFLRNLDLAQFS